MTDRANPVVPVDENVLTPHHEYSQALFGHAFVNLRLAGDVRELLRDLGMGRIHHRVIGVTAALPGVTVGELTQILAVTHQNVRVPMKTLIERGFLESRVDTVDRRARRLYATPEGVELSARLFAPQTQRIRRAFEAAGPAAIEGFLRVQEELLEPEDLAIVQRLEATFGGTTPASRV